MSKNRRKNIRSGRRRGKEIWNWMRYLDSPTEKDKVHQELDKALGIRLEKIKVTIIKKYEWNLEWYCSLTNKKPLSCYMRTYLKSATWDVGQKKSGTRAVPLMPWLWTITECKGMDRSTGCFKWGMEGHKSTLCTEAKHFFFCEEHDNNGEHFQTIGLTPSEIGMKDKASQAMTEVPPSLRSNLINGSTGK